jgi:16S rRNA (adenine1518-N6/adenine1519-N6)-dimethyltransferase
MSLEETRLLLRLHKISPNKVLGQNFMVEPLFFSKLCTYCDLDQLDVVLDAGAGFGFLTCFLAEKCKAVLAVEKDPKVARVLRDQVLNLQNVSVIEGDILEVNLPQFNKVMAIPPYYLSSHLLTWLLLQKIDCAVLILQKEFANRLVAPVGSEEYGWLRVVTSQGSEIELFDSVSKDMFYPKPEVDSIILRLKPCTPKPFEIGDLPLFIRMVKWLFTERNKKLGNALMPFIRNNFNLDKQNADKLIFNLPLTDRRVRNLSPKDFGELANALPD